MQRLTHQVCHFTHVQIVYFCFFFSEGYWPICFTGNKVQPMSLRGMDCAEQSKKLRIQGLKQDDQHRICPKYGKSEKEKGCRKKKKKKEGKKKSTEMDLGSIINQALFLFYFYYYSGPNRLRTRVSFSGLKAKSYPIKSAHTYFQNSTHYHATSQWLV